MNDLAQHYALLLGLKDDWLVQSVDVDLEAQRVETRLENHPATPCCCPEYGSVRPLKNHAAERTWRHLDTMQFKTRIVARIPRTNCPGCGVRNAHLPWAPPHGQFTLLFQAFAIRILQAASSIEKARRLLGLSWNEVQCIVNAAVARSLVRRDLEGIRHVGIDEKNFGKGHDYVCVMTDIDGERILDVVPDRTREAADSLWKTLSDKQKEQVEAVAVDMWAAFIHSTEQHVLQADIVHDRFHIAKHLGKAVDKVRRAEHKKLKAQGDERLNGSRYLWLTNPENLSEDNAATFAHLKDANLKTSRTWAIRELFRDFFEQRSEARGTNGMRWRRAAD